MKNNYLLYIFPLIELYEGLVKGLELLAYDELDELDELLEYERDLEYEKLELLETLQLVFVSFTWLVQKDFVNNTVIGIFLRKNIETNGPNIALQSIIQSNITLFTAIVLPINSKKPTPKNGKRAQEMLGISTVLIITPSGIMNISFVLRYMIFCMFFITYGITTNVIKSMVFLYEQEAVTNNPRPKLIQNTRFQALILVHLALKYSLVFVHSPFFTKTTALLFGTCSKLYIQLIHRLVAILYHIYWEPGNQKRCIC